MLQEKGIDSVKTLSALIDLLDQLSAADRAIVQQLIDETRLNIQSDTGIVELIDLETQKRQEQDKAYNLLSQIEAGKLGDELKNYFNTVVASQTPNIFDGVTASIVVDTDLNQTQNQINENQAIFNSRLKTTLVFPEHFNNDVIAAANYAASINATLYTIEKTYEVATEFILPENLVWYSNSTRIRQVGAALNNSSASVIAPQSNVRIMGKLILDMGSPTSGWGEKAHCRIDSFTNTVAKVRGFYFDTLVLEGGYFNCNGVVMAGGASLVRGKRIECGDTAMIGRVFMAHWGNFAHHSFNRTLGKYTHTANYLPTTHPHDCIIDEVVTGKLTCNTSDYSGVVLVSAGYDIQIGKITGELLDYTISGKALAFFTAGDLALAYASPSEKAHGMRGNKIGSITGITHALGVGLLGQALYVTLDDLTNVVDQPIADDYMAKIDLTIENIDCEGKVDIGNASNILINGDNGRGNLRVIKAKGRYFYSCFSPRNYSDNMIVDELIAIDCKINPVSIVGTGSTFNNLPRNIHIKHLVCTRFGVTSSNELYRSCVRHELAINTQIGTIVVNELGNGTQIATLNNDIGTGIKFSSIIVNDQLYTKTYLINNSKVFSDAIQIEHYSAPSVVTTPVSGGITYKSNGKTRKLYGFSISGAKVNVGDILHVVGSSPQTFLCITAGIVGTDAVIKLVSGNTKFSQVEVTIAANTSVLLTSSRNIGLTPLNTALRASYSVATNGIILLPIMTSDNTFSVYGYNPLNTSSTLPSGDLTVWV